MPVVNCALGAIAEYALDMRTLSSKLAGQLCRAEAVGALFRVAQFLQHTLRFAGGKVSPTTSPAKVDHRSFYGSIFGQAGSGIQSFGDQSDSLGVVCSVERPLSGGAGEGPRFCPELGPGCMIGGLFRRGRTCAMLDGLQ